MAPRPYPRTVVIRGQRIDDLVLDAGTFPANEASR
jgi:hypothetical protein